MSQIRPSTAAKGAITPNPWRDVDSYRSLSNIIQSCLTTIFLCTWVSLHPNVPEPVDEARLTWRQWWAYKLRFFLKDILFPFLVLLIAPEWVVMWALRQRLVVEYLVRSRRDLTRTYGFFIIMGGFHKFSKAKIEDLVPADSATSPAPSDPLVGPDVENTIMDEKSEVPYGEPDHPLDRFDVCRLLDDRRLELPPQVEIEDKSKSDWIAKSLVLLQTLWFVVQCIARKMYHLPLTELEVVTLGYALLNFIVYVIWWDKPQRVTRPIRVFCGELPDRCYEQKKFKQRLEAANWVNKLFDPVVGFQDGCVDLRSMKQIPILYSGHPPAKWPLKISSVEGLAIMLTAVVGGAFGVVHFLAWWSPFPTYGMLISWRWGSILMTIAPFLMLTFTVADILGSSLEQVDNTFVGAFFNSTIQPLIVLFGILSISFMPLVYVAGRVITFVLAFRTLVSLPPEAFRSIPWTNLLPHI